MRDPNIPRLRIVSGVGGLKQDAVCYVGEKRSRLRAILDEPQNRVERDYGSLWAAIVVLAITFAVAYVGVAGF